MPVRLVSMAIVCIGALTAAQAAQAQDTMPSGGPVTSAPPAVNPRDWRAELPGQASQVLTIGSPHLSGYPPSVTRAMLEEVVARLVAFRPDMVTHEGLSGEQCDLLLANPAIYPEVADQYCWDPADARRATGLTVPQARTEIETILAAWPTSPTPAQRRHLASLFYAANDRPSAYVQWLQLPENERREGDGVDTTLLALMTRTGPRMNETFEVAAVVAARLGHQRVYAVDDHTSDAAMLPEPAGFADAMQRLWSTPRAAVLQQAEAAAVTALDGPVAMLDHYRHYNDPETLRAFIDVDHRAAVRTGGDDGALVRRYVGWWETRNLRMVANIRAALARQPGARVLNIVGASHKPWYDAWLGMMSDTDIVDAEVILR